MRKITIEVDTSHGKTGRIAVNYGDPSSDEVDNRIVTRLQPMIEMSLKMVLGTAVIGESRGKNVEDAQANYEIQKAMKVAPKTPVQ